jgi:CRISPR/Cas system CMR subunit Cmr6 (Cas7 group RAMP superfamily)
MEDRDLGEDFDARMRHNLSRDVENKDMAATALNSLAEALEFTGAGSKTAVGYGHMVQDYFNI